MNDQGCCLILKLATVFLLLHGIHGRIFRYDSYDAYYCTIMIPDDLDDVQPLLLCPQFGKAKIIYPREAEMFAVDVEIGQFFRIACPGSKIARIRQHINDSIITCTGEDYFLIEEANIERRFESIWCQDYPAYEARKVRNCGKGQMYEVGFPLQKYDGPEEFVPVYELCHNENQGHTIFVHASMPASIDSAQTNIVKIKFRKDQFFSGIPMDEIYTKEYQRENLAALLGGKSVASKYIRYTGNYFLARGHLIAKADFIYTSQQRSTYLYANTVPMWQGINGGNWKMMENNVRKYVSMRNLDFDLWVGSYGILTLPNKNGKQQQIYLYTEEKPWRVPVPRLLFKLLYNRDTDAGVVLITANNPFLTRLPKSYQICKDVCERIQFLTWRAKNATQGFSYCCEISTFRKVVSDFPLNYGRYLLT